MAYLKYKMAENYVATFVEVAVQPSTGRIDVKRVVCAHDCGLVVNPNALRNQIEGGIVQGLSRALHEEVQFDESRVTSVDWSTYPILQCSEAPAVEVILVERPEETLWGGGEASTVPVAAALGNAIYDATGVRLRRVPFTTDRVKADAAIPFVRNAETGFNDAVAFVRRRPTSTDPISVRHRSAGVGNRRWTAISGARSASRRVDCRKRSLRDDLLATQ